MDRAKERLCFALDVPAVQDALDFGKELGDLVGYFKVGKELFIASANQGIPIVRELYADWGRPNVFLDLKLHDTPATVYAASRQCTQEGVYMFNIHIAGMENMCRKALEASYEGSAKNGIRRPQVIGVTELTSLNDDDLRIQGISHSYDSLVRRRTELAREWGLDGIVCPARSAGSLEKEFGSDFLYVTPGIEWQGLAGDGQKQLYGPEQACRDCSNSVLVVGSAIRKSPEPRKTAYDILNSISSAH